MNCNEARSLWIDLLYGETGDDNSAAVREHLDACPKCRQEFDILQRIRGQLDLVADQPMRVDLARLCLRSAEQWERSRRRWRRIGYLSAAAVILVTVFLSRQVRWELHDGQMLISWRNLVQEPRPVERPPTMPTPPEHLVSADYLRLRTQVIDRGPDAVFHFNSSDKGPSDSPRSHHKLRDQLFKSIDPPSESSI